MALVQSCMELKFSFSAAKIEKIPIYYHILLVHEQKNKLHIALNQRQARNF